MADLINADPREVVFTSGATEANNMAIKVESTCSDSLLLKIFLVEGCGTLLQDSEKAYHHCSNSKLMLSYEHCDPFHCVIHCSAGA